MRQRNVRLVGWCRSGRTRRDDQYGRGNGMQGLEADATHCRAPPGEGQGAQRQRDRARLERRHRGRVDGARLQPGHVARPDRRGRGHRREVAVHHDRRLHPDAADRRRVLLPQQSRPDCGTTFMWTTRAFGPHIGWITGWIMVVADIVVMASLAQITGTYFFLLFGAEGLAASVFWVTFVGVIFLGAHDGPHGSRHRIGGRDPMGPAGGRIRHPRHLLGHGAVQGVQRITPPGRSRPTGRGSRPAV